LEIVKSKTLSAMWIHANELAQEATHLKQEATRLKQEQLADQTSIARLKEKITDLNNIATEYQPKLGRHDLHYNQRTRFTEWVMRRGVLETTFTLVDVGVQGGIHPRWNALGSALRVYGFDPLEEAIAPLVRLNLANHEYSAIALGDQAGER